MSNSKLKGTLTLILGGVRSGKSRFGQELAHRLGNDDVLFVATAESRDEEMARRIDKHRQSRPDTWRTLEQPLRTGKTIHVFKWMPKVVLVDCLTLLVSNVLLENESDLDAPEGIAAIESRMHAEVENLIAIVKNHRTHLIVVSGEVGMGLVPENALGRLFRDMLGWSNQQLAACANETYFMVAGLPIKLSSLGCTVQRAAEELAEELQTGAQK